MIRYLNESMVIIHAAMQRHLRRLSPGDVLYFEALDPDLHPTHFPGESVLVNHQLCRHRDYVTWLDLAESLRCAMRTPVVLGDGFVRLGFRKLNLQDSWHRSAMASGHPEKYGSQSVFARIDKFEQPSFLAAFTQAIRFVDLPKAPRVLSLGVNQGRELAMVPGCLGVGVDHSVTALASARERYPQFEFIEGDLNRLASLHLGRFDLVISINTLQSPGVDGRRLFRQIVTEHLTPSGGVLIGIPNGRSIDHTMIYGAKVKNHSHPELSVMLKDTAFYRRYLHQHQFQVTVTGKHTVLVTGRKLKVTR